MKENDGPAMSILMAAGVPRRREGGVAAIIYNLGRELQRAGHQVTYSLSLSSMAPIISNSSRP